LPTIDRIVLSFASFSGEEMQVGRSNRRDFIALLGGALTCPRGASAQGPTAPMIGFLNSASPDPSARLLDGFHQGLNDGGYIEGRNVAIEYRWAEGQFARLPELAADLVRRQVALIAATGGIVSARAARSVTTAIPILFISGPNPVADGLVNSFSRPGGNLTGVAVQTSELLPKRLQLLASLAPGVATIALLVNPTDVAHEHEIRSIEAVTRAAGQQMVLLKASMESDFVPAFVSAVQQQTNALLVSANPFFTDKRAQLVALAARHALPAGYPWRQYADAGGLMSYGPSISGAYRLIGQLAGRILKGDKPSDLPVQTPTTFELIINLKTAKSLGLTVPPILSALANELID
jgi:putative ABC transport system substrate-binding protein